ncbi:MAG: TIR domain-containing protein [Bacteroidota bacterium]
MHFTFANSGDKIINDVIYPGAPFLLGDFSYKFTIKPECLYWRFGIRLSKLEQIPFTVDEDRHLEIEGLEYRDLHIGVGDFDGNKWTHPNRFQLSQYNFPQPNHVIIREENYLSHSQVEFHFKYDKVSNIADVTSVTDMFVSGTSILIPSEYKFFKVFAWADKTNFELHSNIQIAMNASNSIPSIQLLPFKVGNVTYRLGDMFDPYVNHKASITLLPASSNGSVTNSFKNKINELGISEPTKQPAGKVILPKKNKTFDGKIYAYAYSVDGEISNKIIIETICRNLIKLVASKNLSSYKYSSMPLLGTGAGALNSINVANIYNIEFNAIENKSKVLISINKREIFEEIKNYFLGRYIDQLEESLQKPLPILELEKQFSIDIDHSAYSLNEKDELKFISLYGIFAQDLDIIANIPSIESLDFGHCQIYDLTFLTTLPKLRSLNFYRTQIHNYSFFKKLKELNDLIIHGVFIEDYDFLFHMPKLESLTLNETGGLVNLKVIGSLKRLMYLDLCSNKISNITPLSNLINLNNLSLSNNQVVDISSLVNIPKLYILTIDNNLILDIEPILNLKELIYLKANSNPFLKQLNLILNEREDHLPAITNFYLRQAENEKVEVSLPVKVILLGNHASGKSSFLQYFINDNITKIPDSTHVIKIVKYPENYKNLPDAIFFDFGGQDYYHGIYRAFLSGGSVYVILWNKENNFNKLRLEKSGKSFTQDFTLSYWLNQKKYLENEKFDGKRDPIVLVQSHADSDDRTPFLDYGNEHKINNEFYVSLKKTPIRSENIVNSHALAYLKSYIQSLIDQHKTKNKEPKWYKEFLAFISKEGKKNSFKSNSISKDILPHYNRDINNQIEFLYDDLDQLHKRGLILYYKNHESLVDCVWLNPVKLAEYVHDQILSKEKIGEYKGIVPSLYFNKFDKEIVNLLCVQKVIFKHDFIDGTFEYITPNFLPIIKDTDEEFDLFTFEIGQPIFTLKFSDFLPFGLINQLICFFKNFEDDKKKFWRNQLLFTFRKKAKVLIKIDFQNLEIKVHSVFAKHISEADRNSISKYLFYCILSLYWDLDTLNFEDYQLAVSGRIRKEDYNSDSDMYNRLVDFENIYEKKECRPSDLFISIDEKHFINYNELCSNESSITINSYLSNGNEILDSISIPISIFHFQMFTQKTLKKTKKVVISYSKKDLKLVNKFKDYLVPLYQNGLIEEPWYCTELIAGREWNDEIKQKFNEADIIFFMISENLMSTKYVLDHEIKNAIDKWDAEKSIKIVPILLEPYNFVRKEPYNLGRFTGLPYMLRPITEFKNQKSAWHTISESIRIMIERDLDPGSSGEVLTAELKSIYEQFVKEKFE